MARVVLILLWLFLAFLPAVSPAQADFAYKRDSLLIRLRTSPDDTNKVYQYLETGLHYESSQLDSAGYYYRMAGALSKRLHYQKGMVRYANYYSYILNVKGKLADALQLNLQAVAIAVHLGDAVLYAKCLGNVGASYQLFNDYEQGIRYTLQAIPLLEKYHQYGSLITAYANLTSLYDQLTQYKRAEVYGRKAVALARQLQAIQTLPTALNNLSLPLQHQQKYQQVQQLLAEGLLLSQQQKNTYLEASIIQNMSNVALTQGQYEQAEERAQQVLKLCSRLDLPTLEAEARLSIGLIRLHQQQYQQAAYIAWQGEVFIQKHQLAEHLADYLLLHSDAELGLGNLAQFDAYRSKYDSLRERQIGQKVVLNSQRLEAQFQFKDQAQQINQLRQARQIQALNLAGKNTLLYGSGAALLALLLAGGLLYRNLRSSQVIARQNDALQQQRIRELEREKQLLAVEAVIQGQEQERSRLAKDLHDGLGGLLSVAKMTLSASLNAPAMTGLPILPDESARSMERAIGMLDESITELRRVARNMMPESLIRFGLVDALRDYCDYVDQSTQLTVRFEAVAVDDRLPATIEMTLFRIAQELLNNAVKHAKATEIIVQLVRHSEQCSLTVEDDGQGFTVARLDQSPGSGWTSIQSRVSYLGGQIDVRSQPDMGTSVIIEVPIQSDTTPPGNIPHPPMAT